MADLVIHCNLGEFHPTVRTLKPFRIASADLKIIDVQVNQHLKDWLPNLPPKSIVSIKHDNENDQKLSAVHVTVKQPTKQRYGVLSKWAKAEELISLAQPGDRIEMQGPIYSHFAIYTGKVCDGDLIDYDIIHLASATDSLDQKLVTGSKGAVLSDTLVGYAVDRQCRINNVKDAKLDPMPGEIVVINAGILRKVDFGSYNLFTNNCEHFANECRYEQDVSDQVDEATATGLTIAGVATVVLDLILLGVSYVKRQRPSG